MPEEPGSKTVTPPSPQKRRRRFGQGLLNIVLLLAVVGAAVLFVRAEQQRRSAENELKQTAQKLEEIQKSTKGSGAEVAREVLEKVRRHMDVPNDPAPTVATIVDVNKLREASEFYKVAENGDHLITTSKRAILYSPKRDIHSFSGRQSWHNRSCHTQCFTSSVSS